MPNPKRRHSKARTHKRRAHDQLKRSTQGLCPNCGAQKLPHRVCRECGQYRGREVVEIETE